MSVTLEIRTTILPGNRIEISSPHLREGRPATVLVTVDEPQPNQVIQVNSDMAEAERQFLRDLPQMLQTKPGRWVVYTPQGLLMEGDDELALFRQCFQRGLLRDHFLVAQVAPDLPAAEITENWFAPDT